MWNIWSLGAALLYVILVVQQIEANLEHGIFQTKLDHFRPRDKRVVDFVSIFPLYKITFNFINAICVPLI